MVRLSDSLERGVEAVEQADAAIAEAVIPVQHAPGIRLLGALSDLGDQPQMRMLSAGLMGLGMLAGKPRLARAGLRMLLAHELATALKQIVKKRVDRTRPRSLDDHEAPRIRRGENHDKEESSFPSGHSAGAAATGRAFAREFPEARAVAYAGAGLVALAQVPRCAHYPSDVGVGVAIGIAAEEIVDRVWRRVASAAEGRSVNPAA